MTASKEIEQKEIDELFEKIKKDAEDFGYHLNPDEIFTKDLIMGLIINEGRYGYQSCPCRLSSGELEKDRDIICPCDYRDPDLNDFGACYCGLYVNNDILEGKKKLASIPERRNMDSMNKELSSAEKSSGNPVNSVLLNSFINSMKIPVWRCKVCGYLCARENPPEICPICKVKKDRFERFL